MSFKNVFRAVASIPAVKFLIGGVAALGVVASLGEFDNGKIDTINTNDVSDVVVEDERIIFPDQSDIDAVQGNEFLYNSADVTAAENAGDAVRHASSDIEP